MRLLVTGASGLVGHHVVATAAEAGIAVVASARNRPHSLPGAAEFAAADLADADEAARLVRAVRPTHLVHCAWETRHPTYWADMANLAWVESAARMATEFAAVGGARFVQVGSCAEYDWTNGHCVEGVTPDRPATRYGRAKLAAFAAIDAAALGNFEAVEARLFFVYGPGENAARLIPTVCRSHRAGEVPRLGSGRPKRDFLHATDAASALLAAAGIGGPTGVLNVGSGVAVGLDDIARQIAALAGTTETGLGCLADRPDDPLLLVASIDRLRSTGWIPAIDLAQGLQTTLDYWRTQPYLGE